MHGEPSWAYLYRKVIADLVARVQLRMRKADKSAANRRLRCADLEMDTELHQVFRGGEEIYLSPTEYKLLHYFMKHPERVHSRAQLLDRVWGDHVFIEERTVDVHVKRLREALAPANCAAMVETVRGAGYRFTQQVAAPSA